MPHIDFGKAFATPDEGGVPKPEDSQLVPVDPMECPGEQINLSKFHRFRLGRSHWINIILAIIAILSGLLCAFYFFDGAKFLRAAAVWPGEFFDSRPSIGPALFPSRLAARPNVPLPKSSTTLSDRSGDPFSRVPDLLSLNWPNSRWGRAVSGIGPTSRVSPGVPNPSWPLSQLDLSAPGGDELTQTFTRAITDRGRVARLDARRKAGMGQSGKRSVTQ